MHSPSLLHPSPALRRQMSIGEELADAVIEVHNQEALRHWRHERNAWIQATAQAIEERHGETAARGFPEAARVVRPFVSWHLALPGEQLSVRNSLRFIERLERAGFFGRLLRAVRHAWGFRQVTHTTMWALLKEGLALRARLSGWREYDR